VLGARNIPFAAVIALVVLTACATNGSPAGDDASVALGAAATANAVVVEVIDGDTIDVEIDGTIERVRLIGIDTPETKRPNTPVECFGPEASEFTESLLPIGTPVRVERDVVGRDDYGRLLGYVHLPEGGVFVNREIVRRGYAQPLTIEPNSTYSAEFTADARAAEAADLGMWAGCAG
jgi:micrococcal nuclease